MLSESNQLRPGQSHRQKRSDRVTKITSSASVVILRNIPRETVRTAVYGIRTETLSRSVRESLRCKDVNSTTFPDSNRTFANRRQGMRPNCAPLSTYLVGVVAIAFLSTQLTAQRCGQ